jgi:hypothetical protein
MKGTSLNELCLTGVSTFTAAQGRREERDDERAVPEEARPPNPFTTDLFQCDVRLPGRPNERGNTAGLPHVRPGDDRASEGNGQAMMPSLPVSGVRQIFSGKSLTPLAVVRKL